MRRRVLCRTACAAILGGALGLAGAQESPHAQEVESPGGPPGSDAIERMELEAKGELFPLKRAREAGEKTSAPNIKEGGIVFGYAQSYGTDDYVDFYRWEALTHVGSTFINFDEDGNLRNPSTWTGRDDILESGGAAEAAGVKVIMVVRNTNDLGNFDNAVTEAVMTTPAARTTLVDDIVALLDAPGEYSHGVSFDFEPFSWSTSARDGMVLFFQELRSDLDAAGLTNHEISLYGDPTPGADQWNSAIFENLDYFLYSGYDFATGDTPNSITEHDDAVAQMDYYFDLGLDPSKFVYVISAYGREWPGTDTYGVSGTPDASYSAGFTDGLYDVTLNPRYSGPFTENYVTGDEVSWYTYNDGVDDITVTFDSPRALTTKIGSTLAYPGSGTWQGRKLAGVGFWSLMWMSEIQSWEPIGGTSETHRTRTYPQIYQLCQEILAPSGQEDFVAAGFEGLNFRWRDPNDGADDFGDTDTNSGRSLVSAPVGAGRPASTTNAMQLSFDMESSSGRLFFRHELLASNEDPVQRTVIDTNAAAAYFDSTTELTTSIHTSAAYANATLRMVVMDADRELETSAAFGLNATGWRDIDWDLTAGVTGYNTGEIAFADGDGVLDTAGGGAKDIAFVGFLLETSASNTNGSVILDEVTYRHANAGGLDYKINEVRYDGSTGEFVEIHGPAGSLPAGFQLRAIDGTTGTITTFPVSGSVPNDGGGFGFFVVGDTDVPNVDFTTGFSTGANNLSNNNPSAVQLYDSTNGGVYDSFVYEAFGGLDELVAQATLGVGNEGFPWFGRAATGTDSSGAKHAAGRYPDGADSNVNHDDFSLMKATPGAANGTGLTAAGITTYDFSTIPSTWFTSFASAGDGSVASGVGASPSGGNVLRTVDESGGGTIAYLGDAALGADGNGYQAAGEIFLPNAAAPAQAVAVGFCGGQGSTFFSATTAPNSYENGYWLIYENNGTADLNDGLASHPGVVHFVHASHDNQDGSPVESLGSLAVASGAWTTFDLTIDPAAAPASQLVAKIGGNTVYAGAIPSGGRTNGPVMAGFFEFTGTPVSSVEGTWIDNLRIGPVGTVPVELDAFSVD